MSLCKIYQNHCKRSSRYIWKELRLTLDLSEVWLLSFIASESLLASTPLISPWKLIGDAILVITCLSVICIIWSKFEFPRLSVSKSSIFSMLSSSSILLSVVILTWLLWLVLSCISWLPDMLIFSSSISLALTGISWLSVLLFPCPESIPI